jgi:hypothetical protein
MKRAYIKASGIALTVLALALVWLLGAGASIAAAGGPNPILFRGPRPVIPPSSVSALTVTVLVAAALLGGAVLFALLQRRADRHATLAEVKDIGIQNEQDEKRKAA